MRAWERKHGDAARGVSAATSEDDWRLLEWWFAADAEQIPEAKFRRTRLVTLLSNWNGELVQAARAAVKHGVNWNFREKEGGGLVAGEDYPEDWVDYLDPEINAPNRFEELPESGRKMIVAKWKSQ